ncbi:hypothetical protein HDN1F_35280 [gamma proteobacterium HdN1]|nr:hypothetical protein HDN1F_35280 [gamma proteobacterium HdN1]
MSPCGSTPVRPITDRHSLSPHFLYPHLQQRSLRFACPEGRRYGLTLFHLNDTDGLDPALSTGGRFVRVIPVVQRINRPRAVLARACQHLWLAHT